MKISYSFIYQRQRFYNLNLNFVTIYILNFKTLKSNRKGEFKRRINDVLV